MHARAYEDVLTIHQLAQLLSLIQYILMLFLFFHFPLPPTRFQEAGYFSYDSLLVHTTTEEMRRVKWQSLGLVQWMPTSRGIISIVTKVTRTSDM